MNSIIQIPETESTNQHLSALLQKEDLEEGTIVITKKQTAGKGQGGNSWESEVGKNLTFSLVLYPDIIEAQDQFIISQLVSLSIVDSLSNKIEDVRIKWPNDIYVNDKKIAGILIENVLVGKYIKSCIIGIGLNVNQEKFLSDAPNPISLKNLTNKDYDLTILLNEIRSNIFKRYMALINEDREPIINEYFSNLYRNKGYFPYKHKGTIFDAKITTVLPSGKLVVESRSGEIITVGFKEIEMIIT